MNEGCNSWASLAELVLSFIACFILPVIAPLGAANGVDVLHQEGDGSLDRRQIEDDNHDGSDGAGCYGDSCDETGALGFRWNWRSHFLLVCSVTDAHSQQHHHHHHRHFNVA